MNAIAPTTSIEPRNGSRPLAYPHSQYLRDYATLAEEPPVERSNVLRLPAMTVATLRYTAPDVNDLHITTRGIVTEASILLAAWRDRRHMSAWSIAEELHERFWPTSRLRGFRRSLEAYRNVPRRGFDLIAATEALGYVQWFADVEDPDDWRKYTTVRLSEALGDTN